MFIHLGTKKVFFALNPPFACQLFIFFHYFSFESSPTHSNFESLKLPGKLPVVQSIVRKIKKTKKNKTNLFPLLSVLSSLKSKWYKSVPEVDSFCSFFLSLSRVRVKLTCGRNQEPRTHDVPLKSRGLADRPQRLHVCLLVSASERRPHSAVTPPRSRCIHIRSCSSFKYQTALKASERRDSSNDSLHSESFCAFRNRLGQFGQ